jgi:hypothetical protein
MNTKQIELINSNNKLIKLLMINEINKAIAKDNDFAKKTFSHSLLKADFFGKADENYKSTEVKEIFSELNITFKDKYEYFNLMYGMGKTQTALLISISKLDKEIIEGYIFQDDAPTLDKLNKFVKGTKETEMNVTAEGISEKSETAKPKKVTTEAKHVEAKISEGATKNEVIELINKLMADYQITPTELIAVNSEIAMAC